MIIELRLSVEHINVVLQGLAELPFKLSSPVIQDIQSQAQEQIKTKLVPDNPQPEAEKG